jgi:hypothetical protein
MRVEEIGYCGYDCSVCAARSDDPEERQRLVVGWKKYLGHEHYTAENVKCDGCRSNGRVADQQCEVRPCAQQKGLTSCALCLEFPCAKVGKLMASKEGLLLFCYPRTAGISEQEYDLCLRQFDSMTNLVGIMASGSRLPAWVTEAGTKQVEP